MSDQYCFPPIRVPSKQLSPHKNSPSDFTRSLSYKKNLLVSHSDEIQSRVREMNSQVFNKIEELNRNIQEMDQIDSIENPLFKEKGTENLKTLYNFYDFRVNSGYAHFHNDRALAGARYNNKKRKDEGFSRKKCKDLKEILRFSMKPKGSQLLHPGKYREFLRKFEANEEEIERIEKLKEFKAMEKANEEKRKKVFIRTLVESAEKQIIKNHMKNKEKHSCSISPELRSPAKSPSPSHSRNSSTSKKPGQSPPRRSQMALLSPILKLPQPPRLSQPQI